MDHFTVSILFLLLTLAIFQALQFLRRNQENLPPGPIPLPIVGNLFVLGQNPHKSLANLAKIYGPLMTLKLGQITTLVISSATIAKEVFKTHDLSFSNRPAIHAVEAHHHRQVSIGWLPVGPNWRNLRKICNSHLFSNHKLEANQHIRCNKIQQLINEIQEFCVVGEVLDIGEVAFRTILDALSSSIFSLDLSSSNLDIVGELKVVVRKIMDELGRPNLADYFPVLRKIDLQRIKQRMTIHHGKLLDLFDSIIDQRLKLRKEGGYIPSNDMLDTLLTIMDENSDDIDRNCTNHLLMDLFVAGTDTTSSTLEWAMVELLHNPRPLSKAKQELEIKIGKRKLFIVR